MKNKLVCVVTDDFYYDSETIYEIVTGPTPNNTHNNITTVSRSELDTNWTAGSVGEQVAVAVDYGNGVNVRVGDKNLDLDYSEIIELYVLLHYHLVQTGQSVDLETIQYHEYVTRS